MRILHIISGLNTGGTELFLERLIHSLSGEEFQHTVISLTVLGPVGARLKAYGIDVHALEYQWRPKLILDLFRLRRITLNIDPDVVQGWLYHGNLAAYAAIWLSGRRYPMLWNIRHSLDQWSQEKFALRGLIRLGGWLARSAAGIVFNSTRSARQHERFGYPRTKACLVPNGFDLQKYFPNEELGIQVRRRLIVGDHEILFGMVSRYHPLKDHGNFLGATRIVADSNPSARFLLVGRGITKDNASLIENIRAINLEEKVMLLGEREDIPSIMNALDIYVSSSSSEAFPNAVGEAMCCEVPCVVTDAGDSGELVANTGIVVPPKEPESLARGMLQLADVGAAGRKNLGFAARQRIEKHYSNEHAAIQYADLYRSIIQQESSTAHD